jgi:hypothetical protein
MLRRTIAEPYTIIGAINVVPGLEALSIMCWMTNHAFGRPHNYRAGIRQKFLELTSSIPVSNDGNSDVSGS